jgi:hypothetical protein
MSACLFTNHTNVLLLPAKSNHCAKHCANNGNAFTSNANHDQPRHKGEIMSITAMKQALDALEQLDGIDTETECVTIDVGDAITSLRQAIEKAERQERLREPTEEMILSLRGNSMLGHEDARDALRDILEETPLYTFPPQRQPLTEWQPIETAPRDGTAVLVMRDIWPGTKSGRAEKCYGHNTYVAEWWQDEGDGGEWVCYMDRIEEPVCPIEPTHWMPLPAPPIEAAHEIKGEA